VYVLDDLMSLLDAGMHTDHPGVIIDSDAMFSENVFGYAGLRGRTAVRSRVGTDSWIVLVFWFCIWIHEKGGLYNYAADIWVSFTSCQAVMCPVTAN